MAILLALFAAGANAIATVLQRIGVEEADADKTRVSLMARVLHRPVWFFGLALTTASFLLQAIALSLGDLSTIQPIMVTEILFLVFILATWFHQWVSWREWLGAVATAAGLGLFLALSSSHGGNDRPDGDDWLLLIVACAVAVSASSLLARRATRQWRAACYGFSAGIAFALTAAFIKATAEEWPNGLGYVFSHFEAYGVAAAGLAGLVISQNALQAGPVAASQSALLIVNPLSSIVMGIWLFGDRVQAHGVHGYVEALSLIVMFAGLFVLAHSPLVSSTGTDRLSEARGVRDIGIEGCPN